MIEIKHRLTAAVLFKSELAATIKEAVIEARNSGADLRGADLRGADLRGADLRGAYLSGADLSGADLRGAYLRGAYLRGADLSGAYLSGADLSGADLSGAFGLLKDGIIPLQISGTKHWIVVRQAGFLTIGCHHNPLTWWEKHYKAVGEKEGYSNQQITEYRAHIAHARAWMEALGVVELEPGAATNA